MDNESKETGNVKDGNIDEAFRKNNSDERIIGLLEEIRENGTKTAALEKKRITATRWCAFALVLLMICVVVFAGIFIPKLNGAVTKINETTVSIKAVANQISDGNVQKLIEHVDALIEKATPVVGAIKTDDIENLSQAISDLKSIIAPLAKVMN